MQYTREAEQWIVSVRPPYGAVLQFTLACRARRKTGAIWVRGVRYLMVWRTNEPRP